MVCTWQAAELRARARTKWPVRQRHENGAGGKGGRSAETTDWPGHTQVHRKSIDQILKMPVNVQCCLALTGGYIVTVCGVAASVLRLGLENNLRVEREQRQSLQKALQREQDNSVELRTQLQQLQGLHEVSQEAMHACMHAPWQHSKRNLYLTSLLLSGEKGTAEFEGGEAAAAAEMRAAGTDPAGDGPAPQPVSAALASFHQPMSSLGSLWSSSFY